MKRGFTLIELLIAVLIIGVLTAVALPMYQKSVDKSRYATLMPLAKNIKDAQEVFYLGGGKYSQDLGSLDVRVPGNPSGATATLSDGTTVEISTTDGYGYVKLSKNNLNNNYIIYQDRSQNYPGEIHCEALTDSDRANELCQNLGGQKISGSLTDGYTTYILSGTGAGVSPDLNQEAENHGNWQSCDTYPCEKVCDRTVKTGYDCNGTYNEDGTYSERVCAERSCVTTEYDEQGNKIKREVSECYGSYDSCYVRRREFYDEEGRVSFNDFGGTVYQYDENGNLIAEMYCLERAEDGTCASAGGGKRYYYENGKLVTESYCVDNTCSAERFHGPNYTYNENGQLASKGSCGNSSTWSEDGLSCKYYGTLEQYSYEGEQLTSRQELRCKSEDVYGRCEGNYRLYSETFYDEKGNPTVLRTSYSQSCLNYYDAADCTPSLTSGIVYEYQDGLLTKERKCDSFNEDNTCATYAKDYTEYAYEDGKLMQKTDWWCATNMCMGEEMGHTDTYYTYDEDGNMLTYWDTNNPRDSSECYYPDGGGYCM